MKQLKLGDTLRSDLHLKLQLKISNATPILKKDSTNQTAARQTKNFCRLNSNENTFFEELQVCDM